MVCGVGEDVGGFRGVEFGGQEVEFEGKKKHEESVVKRSMESDISHRSIQTDEHVQVSISEFTKEEIDEILLKLKKAHDKISQKDEKIAILESKILLLIINI